MTKSIILCPLGEYVRKVGWGGEQPSTQSGESWKGDAFPALSIDHNKNQTNSVLFETYTSETRGEQKWR